MSERRRGVRRARRLRAAQSRRLSATGQAPGDQLCLWPATGASWTCDPRQQAEPEPDEVVEGDEDLWGRTIDSMIRRSQQSPGSEIQPTQLDSRKPDPGATLQGPGAAAPVSSEEAAEYLARLDEEFPADRDEDSDA